MMIGGAVDFTRPVAPEAWRRMFAIVIDGLRAREDLTPLESPRSRPNRSIARCASGSPPAANSPNAHDPRSVSPRRNSPIAHSPTLRRRAIALGLKR
jgi:hypothetical protein